MAEKPWKARRSDDQKREFTVSRKELENMKPEILSKLEVDFGTGWVRPGRFDDDGSGIEVDDD